MAGKTGKGAEQRKNRSDRVRADSRRPRHGRGGAGSRVPTWLALGVILLLGALLRIGYLTELRHAPDFASPAADAAFHDYWARGLVTGDWTPPPGEPDPRIQTTPFSRPPGYPYALAFIYALTGGGYLAPRIIQMLLGLLNVLLVFLLGRTTFGRGVGLVAAGLYAVSWPLIYFEGELHAPTLVVTAVLVILLLLRRWQTNGNLLWAGVAGIVLGLGALVRANLLLFAPAAAVWMILASRRGAIPAAVQRERAPQVGWRRALVPAAVLALGVVLGVAPATIRNALVAREFVLVSTNGPINLWIGNNPVADGVSLKVPDAYELTGSASWSMFSYDRLLEGIMAWEGKVMGRGEAASRFGARAWSYIREHPGRFLSLTARRAALFWGPVPVSNNKAVAFERAHSRVLRWLMTFPVALALGLLGLGALAVHQRSRHPDEDDGAGGEPAGVSGTNRVLPGDAAFVTLLLVFVLTWFLSFLPFLIATRFQMPVLPVLFVFGAFGVVQFGSWIRTGDWTLVGASAAALVALLAFTHWNLAGYRPDAAWWHTDRGLAYERIGDPEEALNEFWAAIRENPGYVDGRIQLGEALVRAGRGAEAVEQFQLVAEHRPERVDVRLRHAQLLLELDRPEEAVTELRSLHALAPEMLEPAYQLGRALAGADRPAEAVDAYRDALRIDPENAQVLFSLGNALTDVGDPVAAEAAFNDAVRLDPGFADALLNLGNSQFRQGDLEEAAATYRRLISAVPDHTGARLNLAAVLFDLGRMDEVEAALEDVLRIDPANTMARQRLEQIRRR